MAEFVVDASVAVSALTANTPAARLLFARLQGAIVHAPHLLDAEVGQVLRRLTRSGRLPASRSAGALRALRDLVQERYEHTALSPAAWERRDNLSYYDALYVALATRLDVPLLTSDLRLAGAPGLTCVVETVS